MKSKIIILSVTLLLISFVNNLLAQQGNNIKYTIIGNVNVKNGTKIALVFDSKGNSHRDVTTINNKHFEFKGVNPEIEKVSLYYEENLASNCGMYRYFAFFLQDTIKITSENDTLLNYKVENPNKINKELQDFYIKFDFINDSLNKIDNYKALSWQESDKIFYKCLYVPYLPINSLVILAELKKSFESEQISDPLILDYLTNISNELKKSFYYKNIIKELEYKKVLILGKPYIDFEAEDYNGKMQKVSSLLKNNKFIVLDFYTTWCTFCKRLDIDLIKYYKLYHDKGFDVVSISCDDNKNSWKSFVKKEKHPWNKLWIDKLWNIEKIYKAKGYPTIYYIDDKGNIFEATYKSLIKKIEETFNSDSKK